MNIRFTLGFVIGLELTAAAALLFLFGSSVARRWPRHAWLVSFGRIALAITGLGLAAGTLFDATPDSGTPNPVPFTVTSVEAGRALYVANCAACHGVDGQGGGPQAGTTEIQPPSLVSGHLGSHPDGDIYYWLTNGLPGGMPAWGTTLTDTQRWQLVDYLRALNGAVPPPSLGPGGPTGAADPSEPSDPGPIGALLGLPLGFGLLGAGLLARTRRMRRRGSRPGSGPRSKDRGRTGHR